MKTLPNITLAAALCNYLVMCVYVIAYDTHVLVADNPLPIVIGIASLAVGAFLVVSNLVTVYEDEYAFLRPTLLGCGLVLVPLAIIYCRLTSFL